ncbi:hypothetical protein UFOVP457_6 [uncultured Caudovirales phage]|uniref:Uncharacterized protein n=1 Tax=uncultured Caudovirales phage TaxID=2100421 RepID=A0A6J5MAW5_9CAUD|nr:hypothetical protein UFOVP457_6 [uncultured Caudovirales phage]
MEKNNFKKITLMVLLLYFGTAAILFVLIVLPSNAANKLPYLTGLYAQSTSQNYVIDTDYSLENRDRFKSFILTYQPNAVIAEEQIMDSYQEGKKIFVYADGFVGKSGYVYFAGESSIDLLNRMQNYSSMVAIVTDSFRVLVHEFLHAWLAHEDCNYRWIQHQGIWRKTQEYDYGNIAACGIMAYGSTSFTPVDDWDFKRVSGQVVQKGRVKGTITVNGLPLKGANLIFISQTKTFKPTWRMLRQRFSTIVDILGDGDGSFEIELPPDTYQIMLVPIGDYDRDTHGKWRLADSQIANITEPLFLNGKRTRFVQDPATKGIVQVTNGMDLTFNWSIGL